MGQKINPHALRVGVIGNWFSSEWIPESRIRGRWIVEPIKQVVKIILKYSIRSINDFLLSCDLFCKVTFRIFIPP